MRPRHYIAFAVLFAASVAISLLYLARSRMLREQAAVDGRIVAEVDELISTRLIALNDQDFYVQHCGRFKSWERDPGPESFHRWRAPMSPRLSFNGTAHFENADVPVSVDITAGPIDVELRQMPGDDWLREHPDIRARVIDRRLTFSELFMDEPLPADELQSEGDPLALGSESYGSIEAHATHPAFVP